MPVPIWAGHYIGLPFRPHGRDRLGVDCWGLVRMVMAEQFGIAVPSFVSEYPDPRARCEIGALITRESATWQALAPVEAITGDVIVLRVRGVPMHVGVVLGDGAMLHVECGIDSAIEKYTSPRWASRVYGFFRYRNGRTV